MPTPVETAIHRYDPAIFLLVGLGANLNIGTRQSYERPWSGTGSLLDAVEGLIKRIDKELESCGQPAEQESMEVDSDNANQPEWKAWVTKLNRAVKDFRERDDKKQCDNELIGQRNRMKDYLEEVRALLREKKAKTWDELHPDAKKKEKIDNEDKQKQPPVIPFQVWTSDWWAPPVPQEKVSLYEELYEACWSGEDDRIRELCLPPPEGTKSKVAPIQIVCKTTDGGKPYPSSISFRSTLTHRFQSSLRCMLRSIAVIGRPWIRS